MTLQENEIVALMSCLSIYCPVLLSSGLGFAKNGLGDATAITHLKLIQPARRTAASTAERAVCSVAVSSLFIFNDFRQINYLKIYFRQFFSAGKL